MALLCFDLDGTLVDPMPAILWCLDLVCEEFGVVRPDETHIAPHIGPGIQGLFRDWEELGDPERREEALASYWRHFKEEGPARHTVYEGVHLLMTRLKRQGHRMVVLTAKPTPIAKRVVYHFDLYLAFDEIYGSEAQGPWIPKSALLAELQRLGTLPREGVLIGDRAEDVKAARAAGYTAIGVGYGYGTRAELEGAGAARVFDTLEALDAWLARECEGPEKLDPFSLAE